jgi:pimeloyl-ACP methyl ester carboxylesterase
MSANPPPSHRTRFVDVGGVRTKLLEAGDVRAPWVVLVHDGAFGSDAWLSWGPLLPGLAETYRVVAPDLLGYGATAKLYDFERSPYEGRIRHVAELCRCLGIEAAHFVGSSFGGSLTLVAAADGAWPMLTGTTIGGTGGPYRDHEAFADLQRYAPTVADAERLSRYLVESDEGFDEHVRARHRNMTIPGHWEALEAPKLRHPDLARESPHDDYLAKLGRSPHPLLLVEGARDRLVERGWAQRMAADLRRGEWAVVEGAHSPHLDHTDEVLAVLLGFLAAHAPSGAADGVLVER